MIRKNDGAAKPRVGRWAALILLAAVILAGAAWLTARLLARADCTPQAWEPAAYTEEQKVFAAMSLSFLVYGCEEHPEAAGTVSHILDTEDMGIIRENADITRTDRGDPTTAMIDSARFIRRTVGEYRLIATRQDARSGFYGAAFADDAAQTVWIAYAGSVTLPDAWQSVLMAVGPSLSRQEREAFAFYEEMLKTPEMERGYRLRLTGHSLGGGLAAMVARASGGEAVTISGADGLALQKIDAIRGEKQRGGTVSDYLTASEGRPHSFRDLVQKLMFLGKKEGIDRHVYPPNGLTDDTHCVFAFVRFTDGDPDSPVLPEEIKE